jgi:hypothetical protein
LGGVADVGSGALAGSFTDSARLAFVGEVFVNGAITIIVFAIT